MEKAPLLPVEKFATTNYESISSDKQQPPNTTGAVKMNKLWLVSSMMQLKGSGTDGIVTKVNTRIIYLIALSIVILGILANVYTDKIIVHIAAILLIVFGPFVAYQKRILADLGGIRSLHNQLRDKVNDFMLENNKLTRSVDALEVNVSRLEDVEKGLRKLANTQNLDRLVHVVKEMTSINKQIKENIQARIIQDVMTSILDSDRNMDLKIDKREVNRLILRMDSMPGFDFHEDRFLTIIGENKDFYHVIDIMDVVRNLLDDDVPEDQNVFVLKPKQLLSK